MSKITWLCFALTVHKAQGLSLHRLAVDCKSLNHNGQLYVALCPAAYKKGLQVTNFYKTLLKRPTETLIDFYLLSKKYPQQNHSCCNLDCTIQFGTTCETEYDIFLSPDFESQEVVIDEDIQMAEYVNFIESYDAENN